MYSCPSPGSDQTVGASALCARRELYSKFLWCIGVQAGLLKLHPHQNHLEGVLKHRPPRPQPQSDSVAFAFLELFLLLQLLYVSRNKNKG